MSNKQLLLDIQKVVVGKGNAFIDSLDELEYLRNKLIRNDKDFFCNFTKEQEVKFQELEEEVWKIFKYLKNNFY